MGSFNSTCAVSRAPISPSDKVRLMYIISNNFTEALYPGHDPSQQTMHRGLGCYFYDNFSTVGFPLEATYEDYGIFEVTDPEHPYAQFTLDTIKENYSPNPKLPEDDENYSRRDDEYCDIPAEDLTFEIINDMIREGALYCEAGTYGKKFIGFYPVLEEVYQVLIQGTVETYDDTVKPSRYTDYKLSQFEEMQNRKYAAQDEKFKATVQRYRELYEIRIGSVKNDGTVFTAEEAEECIMDIASLSNDSRERNEFAYKNSFNRGAYMTFFRDMTGSDMTEEELAAFNRMHTEALFYLICLSRYNYELIPPRTSGQEYDTLDQGALLVKMGQALLRKSHEEREHEVTLDSNTVHLILSLNDLSKKFEEHYDENKKSDGLAAIREYDRIYGYKDTILTFEEAQEQGLEALFSCLATKHLPVKFVS